MEVRGGRKRRGKEGRTEDVVAGEVVDVVPAVETGQFRAWREKSGGGRSELDSGGCDLRRKEKGQHFPSHAGTRSDPFLQWRGTAALKGHTEEEGRTLMSAGLATRCTHRPQKLPVSSQHPYAVKMESRHACMSKNCSTRRVRVSWDPHHLKPKQGKEGMGRDVPPEAGAVSATSSAFGRQGKGVESAHLLWSRRTTRRG